MADNMRIGDTEAATLPDDRTYPAAIQASYAPPSPSCSTNSNTPVISVPYGIWHAEDPSLPGDSEVATAPVVQSTLLPFSEPAAEEAEPAYMDTDSAIPERNI